MNVEQWVKSCEFCQRIVRNQNGGSTASHLAMVYHGFAENWDHMLVVDVFGFIAFVRNDLSGWVEGKALKVANSESVSKFIYEDVIC